MIITHFPNIFWEKMFQSTNQMKIQSRDPETVTSSSRPSIGCVNVKLDFLS